MITIKLSPEDYYIVDFEGKETLAYEKGDGGITAITQDIANYLQETENAQAKENV